ncbi:PAS domain-containing protein [uncultured Rhodospira sp.]|uniref:PAS domain-containing protein n=1 Tax=uncultured Rhodospira sp. TaxID=1936189 RepID=UPI00262A1DE8|nr:PAS domain-containing protein [uncultured Rhodospira sp.]
MDTEDRAASDRNTHPQHRESHRDFIPGRADEALREQAELLATGQRLARMGSIVFDIADGTWTVSENWAQHIGLDRTVLSREEVRALIPPEDLPITQAAFDGFFTGATPEYEHRLIHAKTGETLYVRAYAILVRDDSGQPVRVVGAVQDITEQKQAEQALQASEARFRALFDAMPLSLAVWQRQGEDFVLSAVNAASHTLTHDQISALIGSRLSEFYGDMPWMRDLVWRCHLNSTVEHAERAYRFRSTGDEKHLNLKFAPVPPDIVLIVAEDTSDRVRAETRLRETADLLLNAEELAGIGSWEWDVAADTWTVSDNWCRLHGVETPPRTTADLLPIAHPDDMARVEAAFERVLNGEPYDITHRIIHQGTGEVRTGKVHGTPILNDDGHVVKVRGVALDVTDRERDERKLRETTDLMVAGQRLGRMGSFEYDMETERWTLSETWRELSGAEVSATTTEELMVWIHPDDRNRVAEEFRAALRGDSHQMEHRVIHYTTRQTLHLRAYGDLVHDQHGRPTRFLGLVQDITEEKRREQALANSLTQLTLAQRIASIGSWTLDPAVGVPVWSDEVFRIYERDPALGPPSLAEYDHIYTGEHLAAFRAAIHGAVHEGRPYDVTLRLDLPDGRVKWVHGMGQPNPTRGPAGHVVNGTIQDITHHKREQEFREDVERIIRHDMRSPIAATISGINILRLSDTLSDDNRHVLDMMERSAQRQLTLLDASMALYRMEAGTFDLVPAPVDLRQVMDEVREELAYLAAERSAHIRVTAAAPLTAVGDPWLCRTLLSNLVRNALEALPAKRLAVEVGMTAQDGAAVVHITNPGTVPDAIRDRFFEKYSTSGKPGGTGLGTYSARMMAQAQAGSVALDTSVAGQTTVTVRLPLADADQAPA